MDSWTAPNLFTRPDAHHTRPIPLQQTSLNSPLQMPEYKYSEFQLNRIDEVYRCDPCVPAHQRAALANELGLTIPQVDLALVVMRNQDLKRTMGAGTPPRERAWEDNMADLSEGYTVQRAEFVQRRVAKTVASPSKK